MKKNLVDPAAGPRFMYTFDNSGNPAVVLPNRPSAPAGHQSMASSVMVTATPSSRHSKFCFKLGFNEYSDLQLSG